jgi:eukaryotic-like serine/threonine-protein kinase
VVGRTLGKKYLLVRLIGAGGMGSVYEAQHLGTLGHVALKLIHKRKLALGSEASRRFRREARAAGSIDSPNIVKVLDSGEDEATGDLYLVMERLVGEDLQRLVERVGPLPPDVAVRIAGQALSGLACAHATGIVHRDLKPANLFLAEQAGGAVTVKLLDFGIAKMLPSARHAPSGIALTRTGGMLGSPLYMSPEQVENSKGVDPRTDVWSLGSALYCALTGVAPHQQHVEMVGRLFVAICASPARPLRERAPWVSPEIARVVHDALAIDPADRTPSAVAMLEAIQRLAPGGISLRQEMLAGIPREEHAARAAVPTVTTTHPEHLSRSTLGGEPTAVLDTSFDGRHPI